MAPLTLNANESKSMQEQTEELFRGYKRDNYVRTDRLFVGLMAFQWIFGVIIAFVMSPRAWAGASSSVHPHIWVAIFLGGAVALPPILLGIFKPGQTYTRHVIACAQMLYSALLIHLTGGRIETHFHVFGSLAFLAFYRDWRVLIPATIIVALDHYVRGVYWPQSVFGVLTASPYRWMEHTAWVIFEDIFIIRSCQQSVQEMKHISRNTAEVKIKNQKLIAREKVLQDLMNTLDAKVKLRTEKLMKTNAKLRKTHKELKATHSQLVQAEKMASIGQLAAGVAHEINNPIGFISSNLQILEEYMESYFKALRLVENVKQSLLEKDMEKVDLLLEDLAKNEKDFSLQFILSDIGPLLEESKRGLERVKKTVLDLRTFAREDRGQTEAVKVESVMDSILSIVHSEIKYRAHLEKSYGDTPLIQCNPQKIGQVFMNLVINASQAIEENGKITIKTYRDNGNVCVEVGDTGRGIPPDKMNKIFEPFYTSKPIGEGTGLGLSLSYDILKKCGGDIQVTSRVGVGSVFRVILPVLQTQ